MLSSMGGFEKQRLQSPCMIMPYNEHKKHDNWVIMEGDLEDTYNNNNNNNNISSSSSSSSTSSIENSDTSSGTLSSSDLLDDASSSSTSCSSSLQSSNGPLYELSELITQLPIKRGLSKYYQGKSQSFTSLSRVESIEDLAKKETPYSRKMKACKSYAGGLDAHKAYTLPKATISKKPSRGSSPSLSKLNRRGSFMNTTCTRLPPIPQSNNMQC